MAHLLLPESERNSSTQVIASLASFVCWGLSINGDGLLANATQLYKNGDLADEDLLTLQDLCSEGADIAMAHNREYEALEYLRLRSRLRQFSRK